MGRRKYDAVLIEQWIVCGRCEVEKLAHPDEWISDFSKDAYSKSGYHCICKDCFNERRSASAERTNCTNVIRNLIRRNKKYNTTDIPKICPILGIKPAKRIIRHHFDWTEPLDITYMDERIHQYVDMCIKHIGRDTAYNVCTLPERKKILTNAKRWFFNR